MKKMFFKCTIFLSIMFLANLTFAQDMIILKTGDEIKSKVMEITPDLVKYKKWENQEGPAYSTNKSDIFMIKYANGTKDVFNTSTATNSNSDQNSILNNGNKFIGTWIYPDGAYDIYRIYKITISRNGEDFLLNTESGTNDIGTTYKKAVGKLVGTSIEIDAYTKASLIGNGNKLLLGEREYIKSTTSSSTTSNQSNMAVNKVINRTPLNSQNQSSNTSYECKYTKDEIDAFTKKRTVYSNNEILHDISKDGKRMWLIAFAVNINGTNNIQLEYGFMCNNEVDKTEVQTLLRFDQIDLLLDNEKVLTLKDGVMPKFNIQSNYFIYYKLFSVNDSTWAELKNSPLKELRLSFNDVEKAQQVIDPKYSKSFMNVINCIDALGIPKSK